METMFYRIVVAVDYSSRWIFIGLWKLTAHERGSGTLLRAGRQAQPVQYDEIRTLVLS
jgi:hypothetical protein